LERIRIGFSNKPASGCTYCNTRHADERGF
jgi:hypothetical protein